MLPKFCIGTDYINPSTTNDAHVSWSLHKPIGIYMGDLILGAILELAHGFCFL